MQGFNFAIQWKQANNIMVFLHETNDNVYQIINRITSKHTIEIHCMLSTIVFTWCICALDDTCLLLFLRISIFIVTCYKRCLYHICHFVWVGWTINIDPWMFAAGLYHGSEVHCCSHKVIRLTQKWSGPISNSDLLDCREYCTVVPFKPEVKV